MMPNRPILASWLALLPVAVLARPVIIESSATLTAPDAAAYPEFGREVATNGNYALVSGFRGDGVNLAQLHYFALLYRRVGTQWVFQRVLDQNDREYDSYVYPVKFAMKGNLAGIALSRGYRVWEFDGSAWINTGAGGELTEDLETDGQSVLAGVGEFRWNARVSERGANGTWTSTFLEGQPRGSDDEFWGGPVDVSGPWAILATPYTYDLEPQEIPVYERSSAGWALATKLQVPAYAAGFGDHVAMRDNDAVVSAAGGAYYWRFPNTTRPAGRLRALGARNDGGTTIEKHADYVFMREFDVDLGVHVINVYRAPGATATPGDYGHVGKLVAKNGADLGLSFDVGQNTVFASDLRRTAVHVFNLPNLYTTAAPRYDDFEGSATPAWTPGPGAQYAVATSGANRVYRQSSVAGDAHAVHVAVQSRDVGIEADIRPTAFASNDRWVGLATRYEDAQNYYYVTLRNSGSVQLKRMRDGVFSLIATAPFNVVANRTYRVRLESIGETHRVYVDGERVLDADDPGELASGSVALLAYQSRADFDNVIVSPSPRATIVASDFAQTAANAGWPTNGTGQWSRDGVLAQRSVAGDARTFVGIATGDQVVSARVQPVTYAAPEGAQERWSGLMARYRNETNYYYLTLRNSNTVSLRKLVNGVITPLASATFASTPGTTYALRLEAVGNQLRGYVNGNLIVQATDSSHVSGAGGLVTFKTAANFDDYVAYQP